ncbi:hypothetical protein [Thalassospira tepidiphila]|uniref:hypothetical protein n=1 Tax=Thalassospira tepidiphila TaxID=393657 RepID=UPI0030C6EAE2
MGKKMPVEIHSSVFVANPVPCYAGTFFPPVLVSKASLKIPLQIRGMNALLRKIFENELFFAAIFF